LRRIAERATVSGSMNRLAVTERARERIHFERPIGGVQTLYPHTADADTHAEAIHPASREAGRRRSAPIPAASAVAAS
jgi:hypothetical protein